uniref:Amaranthin-like lectin n=1 Tax=Linum usitatissimum TaxID=4006 RepID=A0A097PIE3_LINUS|nr:amaranthin-like lectin [Linum usitatissimum]
MAPPPKLPRFIALYAKTAKKYVKYQSDGGHGYKQILTAKSEQLSSSLAKFEVVESTSDPSMVHIRCCYNNKYLRIDNSSNGRLITASMDGPEENQTVWYSTLFQPELLTDGTIRLLHIKSGYYMQWLDAGPNSMYRSWIHVISSEPLMPKSENILQVIDWDTLFSLPRHLTFKGDNGLYLGLLKQSSGAALRFEIGNERDESIVNEIVDLLDGTFRIKNVSVGAFWRVDPQSDEMRADDTSATPTPYSMFSATKVNYL